MGYRRRPHESRSWYVLLDGAAATTPAHAELSTWVIGYWYRSWG